jgi:hypothetical protein
MNATGQSKRVSRLALAAAIVALCAATAPSSAQVSEESRNLGGEEHSLSSLYWEGAPELTEAVTHDWIHGGLDHLIEAAKHDAETLREDAHVMHSLAANPKMSPELRTSGLKAAGENEASAATAEAQAGYLHKLGKALEVVELVSTTSKVSAYAVEGDYSGAANILVGEISKKLIEGAGMLGLSWAPGGQLVGALAGEKVYEDHVAPILEHNEETLRDQAYAEKYLNKPWLSKNEVMDETGKVRTLDPDMYVEKGTGLIKRRSPEEQAVYESGRHNAWLDGQKWTQIAKDLADGKISPTRYDELMQSYRNRDLTKPWDSNAPVIAGVARFAGSYAGRFTGGGDGSIHFTVSGHSVSGTLSGVCTVNPCENDPVSGSFHGDVTDEGVMTTTLSGHFDIENSPVGPVSFAGGLNGAITGKDAGGRWTGKNRYGSPTGSWTASR